MAREELAEEPSRRDGLHEYVIKSGVSTKEIKLRSGERVSFARQVLDDAVEQVETPFVPLTAEHLSYLPPFGRIYRAEVVEDQDGHAEILFHARALPMRGTSDVMLHDELRADEEFQDLLGEVRVSAEPRNFDPSDWSELEESAPLQLTRHGAWSALPPLIWMISVPVVWGAVKFAEGFISRFGEAAAEKLPTWIVSAGRRAKDAHRHNLVQVRFETAAGMVVSAFFPLDPHAAEAVEELRRGLDGLAPVAQFAGLVAAGQIQDLQLAAFIYQEGKWHLAWWASPDAVHISPWFTKNYPDPALFLGRPLFVDADQDSETDLRELPTLGSE